MLCKVFQAATAHKKKALVGLDVQKFEGYYC